jgi:hypothetical protein
MRAEDGAAGENEKGVHDAASPPKGGGRVRLAANATGYEVDVQAVMHSTVPCIDCDAMSGIEVNLAFGQVEAACGDDAGGGQSEQEVNDAAEHEECKYSDPKTRRAAAPPACAQPCCSQQ